MTLEEAKAIKVGNVMCRSSLEISSRFFFKARNKRKMVVNYHHSKIWKVLELVLEGKLVKVIINIPPRYGKTELAVKQFIPHALALNATAKFIHLSYSYDLVNDNSEAVKDVIKDERYQSMFPHVRLKAKSDSRKKWYTTAGGGMYSTSTGGQVTGFGAGNVEDPDAVIDISLDQALENIDSAFDEFEELVEKLSILTSKKQFGGALIIDDPIKPDDADSETLREKVNQRYDTTIKNRVNSRKTPIILIGQRTHENDLSGHVMETDGFTEDIEEAIANPKLWYLLSIPAILDEGTENERALWDFKHTLDELKLIEQSGQIMFSRQYMQNPTPKEGLMYGPFKTYSNFESIPITKGQIRKAYFDTADKGTDFLSGGAYVETPVGCYITDIIYTQEEMKKTMPKVALMLAKEKVQVARFESNNGGGVYADGVEGQTRVAGNWETKFEAFHQSKNKEVRIFTNSNKVNNMIIFPDDWEKRWPAFAKAVKFHKKIGKNANDDAPDFLTGIVEHIGVDDVNTIDEAHLGGFA